MVEHRTLNPGELVRFQHDAPDFFKFFENLMVEAVRRKSQTMSPGLEDP